MRIGILVSHFPPEWIGGAEVQSYQMASHLGKKHHVLVFTKAHLNRPKDEIVGNFEVERFNCINIPLLRFFYQLVSSFILIKEHIKDIELLQCMELLPNGLIGVLIKKFYGRPAIAWVRGGDFYIARKNFIKRMLLSFVAKNLDCVLVQSEQIRKDVQKEFKKARVEVIPNGIDLTKDRAMGDKVLFVGRLVKRKGLKYLIEACRILHSKGFNFEMVIIGDGPERKKLEKMSRGLNIRFLGSIAPENIRKYMMRGKFVVLPALIGEGFSNVVMEAMSLGMPSIATNIAGLPDLVRDGKTGFLVKIKDSNALAEKIELLLTNEKLRKKMGLACLKEIRQYEWNKIAKKMEKTYSKFLSAS